MITLGFLYARYTWPWWRYQKVQSWLRRARGNYYRLKVLSNSVRSVRTISGFPSHVQLEN
jgi:hypothetical protein